MKPVRVLNKMDHLKAAENKYIFLNDKYCMINNRLKKAVVGIKICRTIVNNPRDKSYQTKSKVKNTGKYNNHLILQEKIL